jgi:type VI secretion system protein ImpA
MTPDLDIAALLHPVPGDARCGLSMLHDPAFDALRIARREDDPSLPTGIWQTDLKVADWTSVEAGCRQLLIERTKDLTVAAWLGESWLHRFGLPALPACFELLVALCTRFWDDLHPLPRDGDLGFRAAPLAWLASAYTELLSARIELFDGPDGAQGTLAQWQAVRREALAVGDRQDVPAAKREEAKRTAARLREVARATSPERLGWRLAAIDAARPLLVELDAWCTPRLGAEAPSFAPLEDVLDRTEAVLMECLGMHPDSKPLVAAPATEGSAVAPQPAHAGSVNGATGAPQSREDAYRQLALIAEYLMRYEPHSPVPYMIQRALEWGSKPLPVLLRELMSQEAGDKLWTALGLLPVDDSKGK